MESRVKIDSKDYVSGKTAVHVAAYEGRMQCLVSLPWLSSFSLFIFYLSLPSSVEINNALNLGLTQLSVIIGCPRRYRSFLHHILDFLGHQSQLLSQGIVLLQDRAQPAIAVCFC